MPSSTTNPTVNQRKKPLKYCHHKATGQGYSTFKGKVYYFGKFGSSESRMKYLRFLQDLEENGWELPASYADRPIKINDLIKSYWQRACKTPDPKDGVSASEQDGIKAALKPLKNMFGDGLAKDFGPLALESLRETLIDNGNCRSYINKNIGRIVRMFKWGVSKELVPPEIYQSLSTLSHLRFGKTRAYEAKPVLPVSDETVEATLPYCDDRIQAMIKIQRLTGARPGEVRSMRPCDIDRSDREVWIYRPESHKTKHRGKDRIIPLGRRSQEILKPFIDCDPETTVFKRNDGKPFERWNYNQYIHNACKRAFPPPADLSDDKRKQWESEHRWAPNQIRHTAATEIRKLEGLEAAQSFLGHSRADVTQIYAQRDLTKLIEIVKKSG